MPSETDASGQARSDLPDAVIRAQLERILESDVFSRSQQLRRFLSFIVEQSLAGPGHSLKESVLAHDCTERERTSMAVPIQWFVSMRGASATNCASTTRADPIPSSSRCPRAATCPSSKQIPPQPPKRLTWLFSLGDKSLVRSVVEDAREWQLALSRSSQQSWRP
jgi:hypothetical protein